MSELFENYHDVLKVTEVCEMLGISRSTLYRIIRAGEIRVLEIGPRFIIPKQSVIEYVNSAHFMGKK